MATSVIQWTPGRPDAPIGSIEPKGPVCAERSVPLNVDLDEHQCLAIYLWPLRRFYGLYRVS